MIQMILSEEAKRSIAEVQYEYNNLIVKFERSEVVRKKQKTLIEKLKRSRDSK